MAEIIILLILAMMAWTVVLIPGDQTADRLRGVVHWWMRKD